MSRTDGGRAFILVIIVSAFAAGALYLVQVNWVDPWLSSRWGSAIFRMLRMILVYVVPAVWWLRRYRSNESVTKELGMHLSKDRATFVLGTGIGLYCIALAAFLLWPPQMCGFTFWSSNSDCNTAGLSDWLIVLPTICVMAMVTDLWTRGFVLLQAADRWGEAPAIALQNALWILLHLYELELLAPSMGWAGAILLALFLGFLGDIIALRERSVVGLMAGHAILNIGWASALALGFIL